MAAAGGASGWVLGGLITEYVGWRWVFAVNVPIAAVALALAPRALPGDRRPTTAPRLDLGGAVTATAGLALLVYGLTSAGERGLGRVASWLPLILAAESKCRTTTTKPSEKGYVSMKLTTTTQVSVDGVMQGNGARDENRSGGFERGGWARPLFDNEAMTFVDQVYHRADAFLFGRRTYEQFASYWGVREDLENSIVGALNTKPKYVASNTLTEPRWANTTVLSGDVAAAVGKLKATPAGELQVHGSGALTRWLLDNELVDEMNLLIVPVIVGQGTRLFPDSGPDIALDLVESRAFPKGITIQVYRPAGRPQYAT